MRIFLYLLLTLLFAPVHANDVKNINEFDLSRYQGKVVYLDFWASWCKPCQKSFPWMNQLQEKYPADKFRVITINLDQKTENMHQFLQHVPAQFTIYHDPTGSVADKFKLPGMPTSYIIDKNGKAVKRHIGFFKDKTSVMEAEIEDLL